VGRVGAGVGYTSTVAGTGSPGLADGVGTAAALNAPIDVEVDEGRQLLYIADHENHVVRTLHLTTGARTSPCRPHSPPLQLSHPPSEQQQKPDSGLLLASCFALSRLWATICCPFQVNISLYRIRSH
jgi:hypothetical protein